MLRDPIGHPSKKLLSFEFAQGLCFQFRASRDITALYRTSELKVFVVWICYDLSFSIISISIYYEIQSCMRERERVEWNEYLEIKQEKKQEGLQPKWVGEEEEQEEEAWGEASFSLFVVRKHWDRDMWRHKQTGRDSRVCCVVNCEGFGS